MALQDEQTGMKILEDRDTNISDVLFDGDINDEMKATLLLWIRFVQLYAIDKKDISQGFNFTSTPNANGQVKYDATDEADYLGIKIVEGNGIDITESGTASKVMNFNLEMAETATAGTSIKVNDYTLKKLFAGDNVSFSETNGVITISATSESSIIPEITQDPTGFRYGDLTVVTYDPTARTITLTGSPEAYWQGEQIPELISGWVSSAHPENPTTTQFLYYDGTSFVWSETPWEFYELQISAVVFSSSGEFLGCLKETHGFMPHTAHESLHYRLGTSLYSGGDSSGTVLDSIVATERRPDYSEAEIRDEDNHVILPQKTDNLYSHLKLTGADVVTISDDNTDIVPLSGNIPYYNPIDGTFSQELLTADHFMNVFVIATLSTSDTTSQKRRLTFLQGQNEYENIELAKTESLSDLDLGELDDLSPEFVFIERKIITYNGSDWSIVYEEKLQGDRISQRAKDTSKQSSGASILSEPMSENFSGDASTQLALNKQFSSLFDSIFELFRELSGVAGQLVTEDAFTPIAVPSGIANYDVLEFDVVNDSTDTDKIEFFPATNIIRIKTNGTFFWTSLFDIDRPGNPTQSTVFKVATWDLTNDESLYDTADGYRPITIPGGGSVESSETTFLVTGIPEGGFIDCEIRFFADDTNLTLNNWDGFILDSNASAGFFNPENTKLVAKSGTNFSTIQSGLDSAGAEATIDNYVTTFVFAGVYVEDLVIPEYVNLIGLDPSKCIVDGTCLLDHQGTTQDVEIRGIRFRPTTVTDNENIVRITSDGSLTFIDNIIEVENYGDIGFTGVKIEGNATLKARDNQITTLKTTSDNGGRDIYGIRADNISNVNDITIQNAFTISHTSADINDNFYGVYVGGASPTHFSNFLFLATLTNASYSGNIKVISYPSDTTTKTFGDLTVRVNDAGSGSLEVIDIDATSGLFQGSNLNLEYNGGGTAIVANINTGAELHTASYCTTGFTSVNAGTGEFYSYGLFNDVFTTSVNLSVDGDIISRLLGTVNSSNVLMFRQGYDEASDKFVITARNTSGGFINSPLEIDREGANKIYLNRDTEMNGELDVDDDITQKGTTLDNTYSPIAVEIPKGSATSANVIKFLSIETTADILNGSVTSGFYGKINLLMDYWNSQNIGYTPSKSEVATSLGIQSLDANSFNIVNYTSNVGGSGIQARVTITNSQITNGGTKATRSYGLYGTGIDIQYNKTSDSIIKFEFGVLVQNTLDWDIEPTFKVTNIQKFDSTIVDYTQSATSNVDWDDIV